MSELINGEEAIDEHISSSQTLSEVRREKQLQLAKTANARKIQYDAANLEGTMNALASNALTAKKDQDNAIVVKKQEELLAFLKTTKADTKTIAALTEKVKGLKAGVLDATKVPIDRKIWHFTKRLKQIRGKLTALASAEAQNMLKGRAVTDLDELNKEAIKVEKILKELEAAKNKTETK